MLPIYKQILLFGLIACMLSCSSDEPAVDSNDYVAPELTEAQSRMIAIQRGVGFTMWDAVKSTVGKDNMVLSPMSVSIFASLLANGADGETRDALLDGLGMKGESIEALNEINSRVLAEFPRLDNRVKLGISNSVWTNPDCLSVNASFTDRMKSIYALEARSLGNDGAKNKKNINDWISKKTEGLIRDFYDAPVAGPLLLVNTVYFKAPWADTDVEVCNVNFTSKSGTASVVPGFKLFGQAKIEDELMIATSRYGNGAYLLTIVMPESGDLPSGNEIASKWSAWKVDCKNVDLTMPEWDVVANYPINDALCAMGCGKIFEENASFANLTPTPISLGELKHGVHIITNSKGTEAAAVTAGDTTWAGPLKEVIVDRPFVYIISEDTTDAILFIGEVTKL